MRVRMRVPPTESWIGCTGPTMQGLVQVFCSSYTGSDGDWAAEGCSWLAHEPELEVATGYAGCRWQSSYRPAGALLQKMTPDYNYIACRAGHHSISKATN